MTGEYRWMTIKEAIAKIDSRKLLLPGIQRKYVWSSDQIEALFDSLMRDYPINTFMIWKVSDREVIDNHRFYTFLSKYRERYHEENDSVTLRGEGEFDAVIDGQQRLTSIYIGLKGSYAYKMPRKWWADTEDALPTRKLFLDLSGEVVGDDEGQMRYRFSFLSAADLAKFSDDEKKTWYEVGDILKYRSQEDELDPYLDTNFASNSFAKSALRKLWRLVHSEGKVPYYYETTPDPNAVLHMFIRLNKGGTELSYSDLIMSITSATWETAREEMSSIIDEIERFGRPGFIVTKDFVLKACLVLLSDNVKFDLKNFNNQAAARIECEWNRIRAAILLAFQMAETVGFDNGTLRAKNALIPIIDFLYIKGLQGFKIEQAAIQSLLPTIRQWLLLVTLKGFFGGQTDTILTRVRKTVRAHARSDYFSLAEIRDDFRNDPNRNLSFNDDFIAELLSTKKDDRDAYLILSLLYRHYPAICRYDVDHLHSAAAFDRLDLNTILEDKRQYYSPDIWDSILNLHLLYAGTNRAKQDDPLSLWLGQHPEYTRDPLMPKNSGYDFESFPAFIDERRGLLTTAMKNL